MKTTTFTAPLAGIHHITTFASDPQTNVDFYTNILNLRLVKVTINFDDPSTYHLYFGNNAACPGSILTFFPIIRAVPGRRGIGEVTATAFAIPAGSVHYWQTRLARLGVGTSSPQHRFGQSVLSFNDPDGTNLELIETDTPAATSASATSAAAAASVESAAIRSHQTDVPASSAITGFFGATVTVPSASRTPQLLTDLFGFRKLNTEGDRTRFAAASNAVEPGRFIDLVSPASTTAFNRPVVGAGSVHHIALRVFDDASQAAISAKLTSAGYHVTEQRDRCYFKSIYFRETGGVLFEIATDGPGFTTDESPDALGTALKLPPWLEKKRAQIVSALPRITNVSY